MKPVLRGLYAVTPGQTDGEGLVAAVSRVFDGGCRWLQFRDKSADPAGRRARADALLRLVRSRGGVLIVNDDIDLALAIGADGVHLGRDDGDIAAARARLGPACIIGASCYADLGRARAAARAGADYVAFGAIFPSAVKPEAPPAPLELLRAARTELGVPVCAIGGITLAKCDRVIKAGADAVAVITDLFGAADPAAQAAAYQRLFEERE